MVMPPAMVVMVMVMVMVMVAVVIHHVSRSRHYRSGQSEAR
jgi:hypothetical protein